MEIALLLAAAFFMGALAKRLRQSNIVGYLVAGVLLGPLLFGAKGVSRVAELGVALLLFSIGLEFSFRRLRRLGVLALAGGSLQVAATLLLVGAIVAFWYGWPVGLAVGALAALSSTAVVLRLLADRAEIDSLRGRSALGILLLQDVAIVPLVMLVALLSPGGGQGAVGGQLLRTVLVAGGLVAALYLLLYLLVPKLLFAPGIFADRELTVLLAVAVAVGSAWAAHALGISSALGAFIAGMLLGESPFATQARADIGSLRTILVALFFASIGMLADPGWMLANLPRVMGVALAIFVLKALLTFAVLRLLGQQGRPALATGIILGQIGEFSFVLATAARDGGLFDGDTFQLMVSVILVLMLLAPYMVAYAVPLTDALYRLLGPAGAQALQPNQTAADGSGRPLIVGYGPAGEQVSRLLVASGLAPRIIEVNPRSIEPLARQGLEVHLGDATQEEVLRHAKAEHSCLAAVTVPDARTARRIIQGLRRIAPGMVIMARCRYHRSLDELKQAGADVVVDEENEVGGSLARHIARFLDEESGHGLACRIGGQIDPGLSGKPGGGSAAGVSGTIDPRGDSP
jgi:CPA2 family monovalent cation:H+ antiporter-2